MQPLKLDPEPPRQPSLALLLQTVNLPPPSDAELDTLLLREVTRVRHALEKANLLEGPGAADTLDHHRAPAAAGKPSAAVERHRNGRLRRKDSVAV